MLQGVEALVEVERLLKKNKLLPRFPLGDAIMTNADVAGEAARARGHLSHHTWSCACQAFLRLILLLTLPPSGHLVLLFICLHVDWNAAAHQLHITVTSNACVCWSVVCIAVALLVVVILHPRDFEAVHTDQP